MPATALLTLVCSACLAYTAVDPVTILSAAEGLTEAVPYAGQKAIVVADPRGDGGLVYRLDYDVPEGGTRAYWDFPVELDLTRYGRFETDLAVEPEDLSYITIYFQSAPGWSGAPLAVLPPRGDSPWRTLSWGRSDMNPEDMGPWNTISAIRVSLWTKGPCEGTAYLREIRAYSDPVAVILPDSMRRQGAPESESAYSEAQRAIERLRAAGLTVRAVADTEIAYGGLEGVQVAVFSHNPEVDPSAREPLTSFVRNGGALLVFYSGPEWLHRLVGVGGADYTRPEEGVLESIRLDPGAWVGAPPEIRQQSWNAHLPQALRPDARVVGQWLSRNGQVVGPAIVLSDTGAFIGHVLTNADGATKPRFLLSLVGHFMPSAWSDAYEAARQTVCAVGPYGTVEELSAAVTASGSARAQECLYEGLQALAQAESAQQQNEYLMAHDLVNAARRPLTDAYGYSVPAREGEFRAVWCHSAFGVAGMTWDEAIAHLAASGFTAVFPNMLWGGMAYYPSRILPVYDGIEEHGDQIAQCLAAAKRHGIEVHVWKVNWYLGQTTEEWRDAARREGRLQVGPDGNELPWLCPSSDENMAIEVDSMLEVARNYDVDGIHLDYIRYPDLSGCYCPRCQEAFEAWAGHTVDDWPGTVFGPDAPHRQAYLEFRRQRIDRVVRAIAEGVRGLARDVKLSAAVFPNWPSARDTVGQDWVRWIDEGWVDFVCPMDYLTSHEQYEATVREQAGWVDGRVPMYPGIGAHSLEPDDVLCQVTLTRPYAPGFTIFNYDATLASEHLPLLAKGATSR